MAMSVGTAVGYLDLDTSKFQNGLKTAAQQLSGFTDSTQSVGNRVTSLGEGLKTVGQNMTKYISVPLIGIGTASVATAANFEKSMSNVAALSGATGKDLEDLTNIAKEMGATTQFSASEAADALGYMALAGWKTEESMSALPGILDLAAASNMGLAEASDMVTDYLSAFQQEADQAGRMADVLAYAQANSNTTTQALGEAFKNCAVNANSFGLDIEQTTALLGKLGDQGLKGSEAGTALNAVFRDMSSKMKDGAIAIGDTNVKITDANGNFKSMAEIVGAVQKATDGLSDSEKMVALQSTFTADSIKAMSILMNTGSDSITEFTNELYNSKGAASEMAGVMNDNLSGQLTALKSALEGAAISIGNALLPVIKTLVSFIQNLVNWFNGLNPTIQTTIVVIGGIVAAIGPVLIIIGQMSTGLGVLVSAFGLLSIAKLKDMAETAALHLLYAKDAVLKAASTAATYAQIAATTAWNVVCGVATAVTTALGAAIAFLTSPIGLVVLAITALIAIGVLLYKNWDTVKAKCQEIWEGTIKPLITNVTNAIKSVITTGWNAIRSTIQSTTSAIRNIVQSIFSAISSIISSITSAWRNTMSSVWSGIRSAVSTGVNAIRSTISSVFSGIQSILTAPFRAAQGVISGILGGISSAISKVTSAIKNVTKLGKSMSGTDQQIQQEDLQNKLDSQDYSFVTFDYAKAKNTTLSNVIATNESMVNTVKKMNSDIKSNNSTTSFDYDKFIDKINNIKREIVVPLNINGKEFARVIAEYTDTENGNRISFAERGLVL